MNSLEKFVAYQKAVEFLAISYTLIEDIPRGHAELCDQLKRSSLSVVLNIAEASGKISPKDKRKHFAIARGSALESFAALDVCRVMELMEMSSFQPSKALLEEVIAMLSSLCREKKKAQE
jgi:four helix bundle protein